MSRLCLKTLNSSLGPQDKASTWITVACKILQEARAWDSHHKPGSGSIRSESLCH